MAKEYRSKSDSMTRGRSPSWVMILMAIVGMCLLIVMYFVTFAWVTGTEISPNNFQVRQFSYVRLPYTMVRLTPTTITPGGTIATDAVLKHLKTLNQETVWHLAQASQYRSETFPAEILVRSLRQRNANGADFWGAWSVEHPTEAAVFWPLVQQTAHRELYFAVPKLLKLAEQSTDAEALELKVMQSLALAVQTRCEAWDNTLNQKEIQSLQQWFANLPILAKSIKIGEQIELLKRSVSSQSESQKPENQPTPPGPQNSIPPVIGN